MKKETVTATQICDLAVALERRHFLWLSIGLDREVLSFSAEKTVKHKGYRIKGAGNHHFKIHHWQNEEIREVDLAPSPLTFHYAQALGEDYLCVSARGADKEKTACVFDKDGIVLRSWTVGDGIADVQTTASGQIWISYFDEGVYSGIEPGEQGLNCYDSRGRRIFGFMDDVIAKRADLDSISDCYALNVVSNNDTWLFYYTGFPIVHLRNCEVQAVYQPAPEMTGSSAFATFKDSLLFTGGYHYKDQIFWRSESRNLQVELNVVDENGEQIIWNRGFGRGADLFLCDGPKVWMISLQEIGF